MTSIKDESVETDPAALGQNLFYGNGVRKNNRKAFPLLLQAAQAGHVHCMNVVGYCYDLDLGVTKAKTSALSWHEQAAEDGHQVALCSLAMAYDLGRGVQYMDEEKATGMAPPNHNLRTGPEIR